MDAPGMYLLKVSVCLAVFYTLFLIFFRNTTFFMVNRFYLLAGLIFSFLIPAATFQFTQTEFHILTENTISNALQIEEQNYGITQPIDLPSVTPPYFLVTVIYCAGIVIMAMRFFYSIFSIYRIKTSARVDAFGFLRVDSIQPFSFFGLIFLPEHEVNPLIIEHEKVHVRQLHSVDLLIVELATVFLWFYPLMFFYKRSIKRQHEYLADSYTINSGISAEKYLRSLLHQIQQESLTGLIHNFYSQSIKNRITMITKTKTSSKFFAVYMLLIPVACLLLFAFADKPSPILDNNATADFVIIIDAAHGGNDTGAKPVNGVSEKEVTLSIAKKIQQLGEEKGIKVILTRTEDKAMSLKDRGLFASRFSAHLFISLHVNYDENDLSKSGFECSASERNTKFEQSKIFASMLLNKFKATNGMVVNGFKKGNAYVLQNNSAPAVAIELGYLSNMKDYKFITNEDNQKTISQSIISSAVEYLVKE